MRVAEIAVLTDPGRTRDHNEDTVLCLSEVPLLAVADGMGGMAAGEVASKLAVDTLAEFEADLRARVEIAEEKRTAEARLELGDLLESAFQSAHDAIVQEAVNRGVSGMGTTMVAAAILQDRLLIGHVGDSRAYLLRGHQLRQLTEDHSVAQLYYRHGRITKAEIETHPDRNKIYQAVGCGNRIDPELIEVEVGDGDVLLLCSDGLCGIVSDKAIARLIESQDLERSARRLVEAANRMGGPDNISVALARFSSEEPTQSIDLATLLGGVFLFKGLTGAEIGLLVPYLQDRWLDAGEVLLEEGEPANSFFVILSGKVQITKGETHLVDLEAGAHLGELALARPGTTRSATVTALEDTMVMELSRTHFRAVMLRRPGLGARMSMALLESVGDRLRDLTERIDVAQKALKGGT